MNLTINFEKIGYFKADRKSSGTGKRLGPGMALPGIVQNREWADRKSSKTGNGPTEKGLTENGPRPKLVWARYG